MNQHEITERRPLLDASGNLTEPGYAKTLLPIYRRNDIKANKLRIKEWDYYCINNGRFALALTIADNSYMGLDSISLLNLDEGWEITKSPMNAFTNGKIGLPESSEHGDVSSSGKHYSILFKNEGDKRVLIAQMDHFGPEGSLYAKVTLSDIPPESMVIATPFDKDKHFYFNQKINCMRAEGTVTYGYYNRTYTFDPADSFAVLDWGRGVWTYKNTWYWGSASGLVDGERFGFNIGYGFGNTSAASENMLFYKGRAHKLSQVTFHIPGDGGRRTPDYMQPWTFTSDDGRFEMDYTPVLDRASCSDVGLIKSDQHQVFGVFNGRAVLDDGTVLNVKDLPGFADGRADFLFLRKLLALDGVGEAAEPIALHVLDAAGIARRRDGGVDGQLGRVGDAVLGGNGLNVALAEDGMLLAAVRAGVVGHVLNDAEHGHVHHVGHVDGLVDDHADKLLRRRDDDHARHGQGLEHRQRHVARSGRHVDEHIVHILPLDVGPELGHGARDDRAAPDDGVGLVREQEVDGHDLDAGAGAVGIQEILAAHGAAVDAERLRDRRAGNIGIEHGSLMAAALHLAGEQARHEALADAALAGDDRDDLVNTGARTQRLLQGFGRVLAVFAAGRAVVGAIFRGFVVMVAHSWGFLRFDSMLTLLYPESAGSQPPDTVRKSWSPHSTTHASARVALASGAKLVPRPDSRPFS